MITCKDCRHHTVKDDVVLCHNPQAIALFKEHDNWSKENEAAGALICDMWDVKDPCKFFEQAVKE